MASNESIFRKYLDALNDGSVESVLALFEPGAIVNSPLYGKMPATEFYCNLFSDTVKSETSLLHIFIANGQEKTAALHFYYKWLLKNNKFSEFECVDIFRLNENNDKFIGLTIIYDTANLGDAGWRHP